MQQLNAEGALDFVHKSSSIHRGDAVPIGSAGWRPTLSPGAMHTPTDKERPRNRIVLDAGAGALAGCISRFVVGPLDVIKIRFQVQLEPIRAHPDAPAASYFMQSKYTSFRQAFFTILKEEGVSVHSLLLQCTAVAM